MEPGNAGIAAGASLAYSFYGGLLYFAGIAHQGGQHGGGAGGPVCGVDGIDSSAGRRVVQHKAAASIDLQVNQPRGEYAGVQDQGVQLRGAVPGWQDLHHSLTLHNDTVIG
jgi:hypothetical protein